jgi:inosine-uridine nucleoside N-ribohydrolase
MNPRKIILDTDPGGDDAFALLWLQSLAKQGIAEIVAVTTVDGNVRARQTFSGASQLLALGNSDPVDVGRGVITDTESDIGEASHIHGKDGMGNLSETLPKPIHGYKKATFSDDLLIEKLNAAPDEIIVIAIGPLTNLASAERKSPGILKKAKEIIVMGGAFHTYGNVTPHAEFNIAFNPEAAQTVFSNRADIVVIPLDVTHHLIFTPEMAAQVRGVKPDSAIAKFVVSLCDFMTQTALAYRETKGVPGFLVHDAATIAYLFYPETLTFRRAQVSIETQGTATRGKTLIDDRHVPKVTANAWIATQVNEIETLAILIEDLKFIVQSN